MKLRRRSWDRVLERLEDVEGKLLQANSRIGAVRDYATSLLDKPPEMRPVLPCDEDEAFERRGQALSASHALHASLNSGVYSVEQVRRRLDQAVKDVSAYLNLFQKGRDDGIE